MSQSEARSIRREVRIEIVVQNGRAATAGESSAGVGVCTIDLVANRLSTAHAELRVGEDLNCAIVSVGACVRRVVTASHGARSHTVAAGAIG